MESAVSLRPANSDDGSIRKYGLIAVILFKRMLTALCIAKADKRVTQGTFGAVDNFDLDMTDLQFWEEVRNLLNCRRGGEITDKESPTFINRMVLI